MKHWLAAGLAVAFVLGCGDSTDPDPDPGVKQPPAAPASITAKVVGGNNIEVSWSEVPGATSYNVYMASASGVTKANYLQLPGNMFHPGEVGKFDHPPGLTFSTEWFFVVTAVNADGESPESCEASAVIATATDGTC